MIEYTVPVWHFLAMAVVWGFAIYGLAVVIARTVRRP